MGNFYARVKVLLHVILLVAFISDILTRIFFLLRIKDYNNYNYSGCHNLYHRDKNIHAMCE